MTLRPFCRAEHNGHVCHRMLGHAGAHVERHGQLGDSSPDVEWFPIVTAAPVRLASVDAQPVSACPECGCTPETRTEALRASMGRSR